MASTLIVDGFDLTPYILSENYTVTRNDLDGPNAGRTLDAKMHRDYLGYKRKVEVKLASLTAQEWSDIEHNVLRGKAWHTVQFDDFGETATAQMYQSSFNGTISTITGKRIGAQVNFIEE